MPFLSAVGVEEAPAARVRELLALPEPRARKELLELLVPTVRLELRVRRERQDPDRLELPVLLEPTELMERQERPARRELLALSAELEQPARRGRRVLSVPPGSLAPMGLRALPGLKDRLVRRASPVSMAPTERPVRPVPRVILERRAIQEHKEQLVRKGRPARPGVQALKEPLELLEPKAVREIQARRVRLARQALSGLQESRDSRARPARKEITGSMGPTATLARRDRRAIPDLREHRERPVP